jgi:sugar O-acyltransferase (sialic acid O-acetyltransferase NeuD family)
VTAARLPVAVLGAGGFAREVRWALDSGRTQDGQQLEVVAFVDRAPGDQPLKGLPVVSLDQLDQHVLLLCGIGGMTEIKERVVAEAEARGFTFAPAVIASGACVGPDVVLGRGTIVCTGAILTADITIGAHVAVNIGCTVGHDVVVEDLATLSPGVRLSGGDVIGRGAYLGTGAIVIEQVSIGAQAVLGAGAVAVRDVPPRALAVGVPAVVKKADRFA